MIFGEFAMSLLHNKSLLSIFRSEPYSRKRIPPTLLPVAFLPHLKEKKKVNRGQGCKEIVWNAVVREENMLSGRKKAVPWGHSCEGHNQRHRPIMKLMILLKDYRILTLSQYTLSSY